MIKNAICVFVFAILISVITVQHYAYQIVFKPRLGPTEVFMQDKSRGPDDGFLILIHNGAVGHGNGFGLVSWQEYSRADQSKTSVDSKMLGSSLNLVKEMENASEFLVGTVRYSVKSETFKRIGSRITLTEYLGERASRIFVYFIDDSEHPFVVPVKVELY